MLLSGIRNIVLGLATASALAACATKAPLQPESDTINLSQIAPGTYFFSQDNAEIHFRVRQGFGETKGQFESFNVSIDLVDPAELKANVIADIEADSITIPSEMLTNFIKGKDWFDTENHTNILFEGVLASWAETQAGEVSGDLTIKTKTDVESLIFQLDCSELTNCPHQQVHFTGQMRVNRQKYAMTSLPGLVGNEVLLDMSGLLTREDKTQIVQMDNGRIHEMHSEN